MFSINCASVKFSFHGAATLPPLSLRNSILPALNSRTADVMSASRSPTAARASTPRAEQAAERADDAHHVGRGQGDVEVQESCP